MAVTAQAYAAQLRACLPRGAAWAIAEGSLRWQLLLALGDGLAAADAAIRQLRAEADPRTTSALLPDWETSVGLPDGCLPSGGSTEQRRAAVVARLQASGGASAAYFVGLAASFGYSITVTNTGPSQWRVAAAESEAVTTASCNSTCADQLRAWGNEQLECLINRFKPAHTQVTFTYGA